MPPKPESLCCGVDISSDNRVLGGAPTLLKQYPWLALIEYVEDQKLRPKCGGSLISSIYVLTAGHCVSGSILDTSSPINVVLGDYDYKNEGPDCVLENGEEVCTDGEVRIAIERTSTHEHFNPDTLAHDIALVKLRESAPFTDTIRPICLPTFDLARIADEELWLTMAGWGHVKQAKSKDGEYTGKMSNVKRHLQVPYVSLENCSRSWSISNNHLLICAGGLLGQDACMGDSGGPLMLNNDGQYQLAGIISFGASDPCGKPNVPGAFTNVFKYYDWIMNVIQNKKEPAKHPSTASKEEINLNGHGYSRSRLRPAIARAWAKCVARCNAPEAINVNDTVACACTGLPETHRD
ncbi:trypsin domain-containing protein [Phthorimaea operculella]|nr:trypsin domain-containing protein [Phthorimaea operculella]